MKKPFHKLTPAPAGDPVEPKARSKETTPQPTHPADDIPKAQEDTNVPRAGSTAWLYPPSNGSSNPSQANATSSDDAASTANLIPSDTPKKRRRSLFPKSPPSISDSGPYIIEDSPITGKPIARVNPHWPSEDAWKRENEPARKGYSNTTASGYVFYN